jgi:hypothetical protein
MSKTFLRGMKISAIKKPPALTGVAAECLKLSKKVSVEQK